MTPSPSPRTIRSLAAIRREERGAILILTALIMIVLLLIAAFATDLGAWYRQGQEQQRAADVASLNGIQAYDASLKQYIEGKGASSFADLSPAEQAEAEQAAMQAALDAITGALAAGGLGVSNTPTLASATPPAVSNASVTADDGSIIQITRDENNQMFVSVSQQGSQYFSNFVRDAPTIERTGSAVISNCNADCSRDIIIDPPFPGFEASGRGDGFGPLLRGNDQIWAVNHHIRSASEGNIICMDRNTEDFCAGVGDDGDGLWSTSRFDNPNRPTPEHIDHARDKIYFAARDRSVSLSGLACFDMAAGGFCANDFAGIWSDTGVSWPNIVNVSGPFEWNDNLYVLAQNGELGCVDPDTMATCGVWDTDAVGTAPGLNDGTHMTWGDVLGDRLYMILSYGGGQIFQCWDLSTQSSCWGGFQTFNRTGGGDDMLGFISYNTSDVANGFCRLDPIGNWARCYSLDGSSSWEPTAMYNYLTPYGSNWIGGAYTFDVENYGKRTYLTLGNNNRTGCWDWSSNSGCGIANHSTLTPAGRVNPYGLALITDDCIVGLGHNSRYFTLGVDTMETCTASTVSTEVYPCACGDGTFRYGVLELPPALLAVLESAEATVSGGGMSQTGDLMLSPMDLSPFNGVDAPLTLTIVVDSKLGSDGKLLWTQPYSASLALTVQPTLAE